MRYSASKYSDFEDMFIRFDIIHERDKQTDRRTDTACQHILRLCIASRYKNCHYYVPRPSFFVCPGDAPVAITLNVVRMEKKFSACQTPCSMYPSVFNSFPVIRTASAKNRHFLIPQPTFFVSPGDAPAIITQYVPWMERQFNACQTPCSKYLSIFNSFRVIRCLSQCTSPKIAIFTKFLFPLGTPLGQSHAKCCMDGKRIRCLQIVSLHVPI